MDAVFFRSNGTVLLKAGDARRVLDAECPVSLPWVSPRGDVEFLTERDGMLFGLTRRRGSTVGNAAAHAERLLDAPTSLRTLGTVRALLASASAGQEHG